MAQQGTQQVAKHSTQSVAERNMVQNRWWNRVHTGCETGHVDGGETEHATESVAKHMTKLVVDETEYTFGCET